MFYWRWLASETSTRTFRTHMLLALGSACRHVATGNYFESTPAPSVAAFAKYSPTGSPSPTSQGPGNASSDLTGDAGSVSDRGAAGGASRTVLLRRWTLGEIVTAAVGAGLVVQSLEEEAGPAADDRGLPKVFTLVCKRPPAVHGGE